MLKQNNKESNYTQKELKMQFPMSYICLAESCGLFKINNKDIAYKHTDYVVLDDVINPTQAIMLTKKNGNDFAPPVKLHKTPESSQFQDGYTFSFNDSFYYIIDNTRSRMAQQHHHCSLNELISINTIRNSASMNDEKQKFFEREKFANDQAFIEELFAKQND